MTRNQPLSHQNSLLPWLIFAKKVREVYPSETEYSTSQHSHHSTQQLSIWDENTISVGSLSSSSWVQSISSVEKQHDEEESHEKNLNEQQRITRKRRAFCFGCGYKCCCCFFCLISLMMIIIGCILVVVITFTIHSSTSMKPTITTTMSSKSKPLCSSFRWNQTGIVVAGSTVGGPAANQLQEPAFIYIDADDVLYICDHHNYRVQKYLPGTNFGITVINTFDRRYDHPEGIAFDKNGFIYISGHVYNRVARYPPNILTNGTTVAGIVGTRGTALDLLNEPLGLAVDDQFNLYIAERENKRVTKWTPNATSGTVVINGTTSDMKFYGLLLSHYVNDQVYVSSEERNAVYLWTFNSIRPSLTLQMVNSSHNLTAPRGIKYDKYGNLYVADRGNHRVVMFCENSTMGQVVLGGNDTTPALANLLDVALDSNLNLYVSDENLNQIIKYIRV